MHTRRSVLAAGAAATAATAGCVDFLLGDDLSFSATAASVSDPALSETGYHRRRVRDRTVEQTFEAGGESRTVEVTNRFAEYERSVDLGVLGGAGSADAATFTAVTSPKVEVLGQAFNPIQDMSARDLAQRAQGRYGGFGQLDPVGESSVTLLGSGTTVTRFESEAGIDGLQTQPRIDLYVSDPVGSGSDFALIVAAHPQAISSREREHVFRLIEGLQHDG